MGKLNTRRVAVETAPGLHGDGNGLYLRIGPTGGKSWILRTVVHGRRRDFGLGSASLVTLSEARDLAHQLRKVAREGGDPSASRRTQAIAFEAAARRVHQNLLPTWRSERHGQIWLAALERYAFPLIGDRPISSLGPADVLRVLEPIWTAKPDTANRVKQRMASIFDWAKGAGHFTNENPVNGLTKALPVVRSSPVHRPALAWPELPAFYSELQNRSGVAARALEFAILTAGRSGEIRGARWSEIGDDTWIIPAARMKTAQAHRVPLSREALDVLKAVRGLDQALVFPSPTRTPQGLSRPLSDTVFKALMDRMGRTGITTHGFRSSFRDWCSESAHAERELAEAALSHTLGNKVERAYARSDLFDRRRVLMERWGAYVARQAGNVVRFAPR